MKQFTYENFKAAVFDLDGTLLDSMEMWHNIDKEMLKSRKIPVPPDYGDSVKHMTFSEAAHYTKARFSLPESVEALQEEWHNTALYAYRNTIELKAGAKELLTRLQEAGVKLGIATSCKEELFMPALSRLGILDRFLAVVTVETVQKSKTFPDVFLKAAELLEAKPEECMVFEDSAIATECAKKAGFYTVFLRDSHSEALSPDANVVIDCLKELL